MNGRMAKKARQIYRRDYRGVIREMLKEPFYLRLQFAWFLITHHR